jgi:Beta/Gamma crystallin
MNRSRYLLAFVTSVVGFAGIATSALADDTAPAATQVALVDNTDLSAQGGRRGGNVGRVGGGGMRGGGRSAINRIGGGGRQGINRVGRIDGRIGRQVGRQIGFQGRIGYRIGRYGRYGYRYGRIGRIGYIPPPVVVPVPIGPGVRPTTVAPCPVCPVQACIVSIFGEQNLQGMTVETRDNQPRLDQSGWQNQIASIMVKSGTWDFFPDLEYRGGPPLRLAPGSYAILEPNWTKRIGSFMCVR